MQYVQSDGETYVYLVSENNDIYKCLFTDNEKILLVNVGDTVTGVVEDGFVNYSAIELPSFRQKTPRGISWLLLIPTYAGDILWDDCNHPTP